MAFQIEKKQTNADKYIRNLTDEELADEIVFRQKIGDMRDCCPPKHTQNNPLCRHLECSQCWLHWLKQEESDG